MNLNEVFQADLNTADTVTQQAEANLWARYANCQRRIREIVANTWSDESRKAALLARQAKKELSQIGNPSSLPATADSFKRKSGKGSPTASGQWVVHPITGKRGVVDHVYHDNANEHGRLMQVDYGSHKANHREAKIKLSGDQQSKWVDKPYEKLGNSRNHELYDTTTKAGLVVLLMNGEGHDIITARQLADHILNNKDDDLEANGTFKPKDGSKFDGCAEHMEKEGHGAESAKAICGAIAQHKLGNGGPGSGRKGHTSERNPYKNNPHLWVESSLINDEASSDDQMKKHFMKEGPMSEAEANHYVGQRKSALRDPMGFKFQVFPGSTLKSKLANGGPGSGRHSHAILPIGSTNLKTGKNAMFGDLFNGWEAGRGTHIILRQGDKQRSVFTSGDPTSTAAQYPVGTPMSFHHDQTFRHIGDSFSSHVVTGHFPNTKEGLQAIAAHTGKGSIPMATFK